MIVTQARTPPSRCGVDVGVGLVAIEAHVDERIAGGVAEQLGQAAIGVGADDEVDERQLRHERVAQVLRHAAGQTELHVGAPRLVARQVAEAADDALLGVLADGAGVEQNDVGARRIVGALVAVPAEVAEQQLGVRQIHLAAVGLDVDAAHVEPICGGLYIYRRRRLQREGNHGR